MMFMLMLFYGIVAVFIGMLFGTLAIRFIRTGFAFILGWYEYDEKGNEFVLKEEHKGN